MQSDAYWETRYDELEAATNKAAENYYAFIAKVFDRAIREIEKQISQWYVKFAKNEGITYAEAKRLLTVGELKEFRMTLDEYLEKVVDPKWAKELERASVKVHVSRLEALRIQVLNMVEEAYAEYLNTIEAELVEQYQYQYYHSAHVIQTGTNRGMTLVALNEDVVKKIISKPWAADGSDFSDRIWKDKKKLVENLYTIMTRDVITGESPQKMIDDLSKKMGVSKSNAGRLIHTEMSFVRNEAAKDSYKDTEVEQYKFVATLDRRTSAVCRSFDGKIFNLSEFKVGTTAPPMHPRCRSTTIPYYGVDYGTRVARDKDGKNIYVPSDMKYQEWYDKFIKE